MKRIIINSPKYGTFIIKVDDEDYQRVITRDWQVNMKHGTPYIVSCKYLYEKKQNGKTVSVNDYVRLHRFILNLAKNDKRHIDHKDGDTLDNRKRNLRITTIQNNLFNLKVIRKNNTSGFKGVSFHRQSGKYRCSIAYNRKTINGGLFHTPIDAAKKYNELAIKFHGEFARLNPISK